MTVDGVEKPIEACVYDGQIVLAVSRGLLKSAGLSAGPEGAASVWSLSYDYRKRSAF